MPRGGNVGTSAIGLSSLSLNPNLSLPRSGSPSKRNSHCAERKRSHHHKLVGRARDWSCNRRSEAAQDANPTARVAWLPEPIRRGGVVVASIDCPRCGQPRALRSNQLNAQVLDVVHKRNLDDSQVRPARAVSDVVAKRSTFRALSVNLHCTIPLSMSEMDRANVARSSWT